MKVIAEETTTLPEGAVISVYRGQYEGKKSQAIFTALVALHGNNRVEMRMDDIPAHGLKQYLQLVVKEIMRQRARLTKKPEWTYAPRVAHDFEGFVKTMAYYGMFILGPWNADEAANTKTILQGSEEVSRSVEKESGSADSGKVLETGDGTKRGSGKTKSNRRRRKQRDERLQPDAVRPVQGQETGGCAKGVPSMVDETESRPGHNHIGDRPRDLPESSKREKETPVVGLPEDCPF